MKKRVLVLLFAIFLLAFALAEVGQEYQWHSSDIILVEINGFNITLQDAINNNYFGSVVPTANSDYPFYSHLASEILVRTPNGYTMTLQEASDTDSFLVGVSDGTINENTGHLADDINVFSKSGEIMTLQELVDYGKMFCKVCSDYGAICGNYDDGCGDTLNCGSCGGGEYCFSGTCSTVTWSTGSWSTASSCGASVTRTVTCIDGSGTTVADSVCHSVLGADSKPSTTGTTSCVWVKGAYIECNSRWSLCSSAVGSSCTSLGSQSSCESSDGCSCGSICRSSKIYTVTCDLVYP